MNKKLRECVKAYDPWCAVFFIDPIVVPIIPLLARLGFNPNVITIISLLTGVSSGIFFALGHWILGAIAFLLTFYFDAIDGKLARYRGVTSEFGAKLDNIADYLRKPSSFLGLIIYFLINQMFLYSMIIFVLLVLHFIVHKLYSFFGVFHCDLEFPNFHKKVVRKIFPRVVALYTYFEEQFIMFVIAPLVSSFFTGQKRDLVLVLIIGVSIFICFVKLTILNIWKIRGEYDLVYQDWAGTKGMLDKLNKQES